MARLSHVPSRHVHPVFGAVLPLRCRILSPAASAAATARGWERGAGRVGWRPTEPSAPFAARAPPHRSFRQTSVVPFVADVSAERLCGCVPREWDWKLAFAGVADAAVAAGSRGPAAACTSSSAEGHWADSAASPCAFPLARRGHCEIPTFR
ncbi:hypothetical protein ABB37_06747 [Leptomonas pyrrhocoris]|uniref:Uncharacterized protein n=1 Tax=Leptomonas pyrrhocoris TaxID=157538 RepID=A0A0M9FXI4_LEPPY|nr:hypothetical protein ABB37_06729 [Leptomonas pyrrhocoris]XP_015656399.1 hypothetical protein ABB37_06729 [Leptomonas pyrrhocoris]XP_015656405.1 hypothetical protein ABB37_06735 [Leptomonas pyrrhocoris]XP_015656406.1 hypothetical protein ABB37_06735 [Leptomonas pyrrhocoris]XP_015656412.1 hypothetical protein ABB37_06741 [Leptomonas pyrrhocoris]XP_015656413.1 hypothetical protein ABB37_06741 [Leptomonas pyrrhocoris]XP_015656420.1 hypothetical protein ABB37_06747 [Leptomonas pyrrhocoris]XP_0|eukprot:XP_015656398.1 hypothetical protein ABB37_06729 [Leptomonas pyrrhocoris]